MAQIEFQDVKGYKSRAMAEKRGNTVEAMFDPAYRMRWVVIALPNGNYVPAFIYHDKCEWQPIHVANLSNCVVMNG